MPTIVIDPGHGGTTRVRGSSPNNATGPTGLREKDVTLLLAQALRSALLDRGHTVHLTRDADVNAGLADRAHVARDAHADLFLSLHFNAPAAGPDGQVDRTINGTETWHHGNASAASQRLAARVQAAAVGATGLRDRGVRAGRLGVLNPAHHAPGTASCLLEVSFLTHPLEEERLRMPSYIGSLATALAEGLGAHAAAAPQAAYGRVERHVSRQHRFDVWNEVPLVPQLTGMSCWAAAAAMVVGWRESIPVEPEDVARGAGHWAAYREGLDPADVPSLARAWGLVLETPRVLTVESLRQLLEEQGPLWAGEASPGLHSVVLAGLYGDGTPDGTFVRINDPWPEGRGARYRRGFRDLMRNFTAAASMDGIGLQLLHSGGRRGGRSRTRHHVRESSFTRTVPDEPRPAVGAPRARYGVPLALFERYQQPGPLPAAEPLTTIVPRATPPTVAEANRLWADWLARNERFSVGVDDTTVYPHSAICKLRVTLSNGRRIAGTGFFIAPDRLLTAAHMVRLPGGVSATSMQVSPGLTNDQSTFGSFSVGAASLVPHPAYVPGSASGADFDLAVVRLGAEQGPPRGEFLPVEELRQTPGSGIIVCGYAGEEVDSSRQHLDVDTVRQLLPETLTYALQTRHGTSGSPVFYADGRGLRVVGVHSGAIPDLAHHDYENRACRLTEAKLAWLRSV